MGGAGKPSHIGMAIDVLAETGELRVRSFIVTLFGDLARQEGTTLSGAALRALTGQVGIKPEAMRVALHRLRKDGWISSRRVGRTSLYYLSTYGRTQTQAVCARIYGHAGKKVEIWHVLIASNGREPAPEHSLFSPLPGVYLGTGPAPDMPGFLALSGRLGPLPDWLEAAVIGADLRRDYADFKARLIRLEALLPDNIGSLERNVLRGLIVHGWRRLLLRHPDLPDWFFSADMPITPCRAHVITLLTRLGPPEADFPVY